MALVTYSDLTTSILSWMSRPGDTNIPVDDVVAVFENDANTRFRTHFQEINTTITTVAGTATYTLPADFVEARELSITSLDPIVELLYMAPAQLDDRYRWTATARPRAYTIEGSSIRLGPNPDGIYTIRLEYYQRLSPLITASPVNWLYLNYPNCYLWGSLVEAEIFLGGDQTDDRFQTFLQRRDDMYNRIRLADRKYRTGGAPLRMMPKFRVP